MTECRFHNLMSISAVECRAPWTFASPKRPLLPSPQKEQNSQIQAVSSYFLTPQPPSPTKEEWRNPGITKSLLHSGGFQGCTRIAMPIPRCSLQPRVKLLANGAQVSSSEQEVKDSEDLFIFVTFSLQRSSFPRPQYLPHVSTGTNIPQLSAVSCRLWHQDAMDWRRECPAHSWKVPVEFADLVWFDNSFLAKVEEQTLQKHQWTPTQSDYRTIGTPDGGCFSVLQMHRPGAKHPECYPPPAHLIAIYCHISVNIANKMLPILMVDWWSFFSAIIPVPYFNWKNVWSILLGNLDAICSTHIAHAQHECKLPPSPPPLAQTRVVAAPWSPSNRPTAKWTQTRTQKLTKPFLHFTPAASKAILKFWHERRLSFRKKAPVTDNQKDFSGGNTTKQHGVAKKLDDGWPESEKDVFQAALRMVVVKDSRWIVGEFYMSYGKIWCEKVRLIKKRIFGKGHQMTCVLQPQRERGGER